MEDLRLSFENMVQALEFMDIRAKLHWNAARQFSAEFSLCMFDTLENILEQEQFRIRGVTVTIVQNSTSYDIYRFPDKKDEAPHLMDSTGSTKYPVSLRETAEGYCLTLSEGGDAYVS